MNNFINLISEINNDLFIKFLLKATVGLPSRYLADVAELILSKIVGSSEASAKLIKMFNKSALDLIAFKETSLNKYLHHLYFYYKQKNLIVVDLIINISQQNSFWVVSPYFLTRTIKYIHD